MLLRHRSLLYGCHLIILLVHEVMHVDIIERIVIVFEMRVFREGSILVLAKRLQRVRKQISLFASQ